MGGVAVAEDVEGLGVAALLDEAVAGEVAARWVPGDEVVLCEEGLRAGVVARVEVDLGEPEGVVIVPWEGQRASRVELKGGRRREVGTNLSAPGVCPR